MEEIEKAAAAAAGLAETTAFKLKDYCYEGHSTVVAAIATAEATKWKTKTTTTPHPGPKA